jgi:hypothetical protein
VASHEAKGGGVNLVDVYSQEPHPVLYQLMEERKAEAISHKAMPSMEEHLAFVQSKPFRAWYLIEEDGIVIGAVSINDRNEVRVGIVKQHRFPYRIVEAVKAIKDLHPPLPAVPSARVGEYVMNINGRDVDSCKLINELGGKYLQSTYAL